MTKEEAISHLRHYRRMACVRHSCATFTCQQNHFKRCVYRDYLISELIRRINQSEEDPIRVVSNFAWELEYILGEADDSHFETLAFTRVMESEACCIERSLREKEKKLNENY